MNTLDLLESRRSVAPHLLEEPGPGPEELDRLLTIAARVPDHGKLAPWRFLVIAGEARARIGAEIAAAFQADEPGASPERIAQERGRLTRAPLVIGVVSAARPHAKIPEWEQVLSAGAVCMNLVVAANAMGYGTSWLTEWYGYDRRILDALGLAPTESLAGLIHIGRSPGPQPDRARPNLSEIVTRL
jgi:nitroreductase